jgi:hypothetical protein
LRRFDLSVSLQGAAPRLQDGETEANFHTLGGSGGGAPGAGAGFAAALAFCLSSRRFARWRN